MVKMTVSQFLSTQHTLLLCLEKALVTLKKNICHDDPSSFAISFFMAVPALVFISCAEYTRLYLLLCKHDLYFVLAWWWRDLQACFYNALWACRSAIFNVWHCHTMEHKFNRIIVTDMVLRAAQIVTHTAHIHFLLSTALLCDNFFGNVNIDSSG